MSIEEIIRREVAAAVAPLVKEVASLRKEIARRDEPPTMGSAELARLLKKSPGALSVFLTRHPSFPRRKVGSKLLFDRDKVDAWLEAHPAQRRALEQE